MDESKTINGPNIIKPPGTLEELQEAAKRDTLSFKAKEALVENYAKRFNMTIEEAMQKLGYTKRAVIMQLNAGNLKKDTSGGVDDESVEKLIRKKSNNDQTKAPQDKGAETKKRKKEPFTVKKEALSPVGMDDERFNALDDNAKIVVTAGMLRRFAHMIRAEERLKIKPITLEEMFAIAESSNKKT